MVSYWACALFTLISAVVSLCYSVVAVRTSGSGPAARYALARSFALTVLAGAAVVLGERHDWLLAAAVAMIVVQALDAVIGFSIRDHLKTFGPAVTAAVNVALLIWYVGI